MVVPRVFQRVCVFCGSSLGKRPIYAEMAGELGRELARRGIELVYGGGHVGLMGSLADGALSVGAMPKSLIEREIGHAFRGKTDGPRFRRSCAIIHAPGV